MDQPKTYHPSHILYKVAERLSEHPGLRMTLSTDHPTLEEALKATTHCVHGMPDHVTLSTTVPTRQETPPAHRKDPLILREKLRALALEAKRFSDADLGLLPTLPIRKSGEVSKNDRPKSPSKE